MNNASNQQIDIIMLNKQIDIIMPDKQIDNWQLWWAYSNIFSVLSQMGWKEGSCLHSFVEKETNEAERKYDAEQNTDRKGKELNSLRDLVENLKKIKILADDARVNGEIKGSLTFDCFEFHHDKIIRLFKNKSEDRRVVNDKGQKEQLIKGYNIRPGFQLLLSADLSFSLILALYKIDDKSNRLSYYFISLTSRSIDLGHEYSQIPKEIDFDFFKKYIDCLGLSQLLTTYDLTEEDKARLAEKAQLEAMPSFPCGILSQSQLPESQQPDSKLEKDKHDSSASSNKLKNFSHPSFDCGDPASAVLQLPNVASLCGPDLPRS